MNSISNLNRLEKILVDNRINSWWLKFILGHGFKKESTSCFGCRACFSFYNHLYWWITMNMFTIIDKLKAWTHKGIGNWRYMTIVFKTHMVFDANTWVCLITGTAILNGGITCAQVENTRFASCKREGKTATARNILLDCTYMV